MGKIRVGDLKTFTIRAKPEWPKRPDGTNKTFGEMMADEQRAQIAAAVGRVKREIERCALCSMGDKR